MLGYGDKQKEFAERLDMKQGSYSDVERGKTKSISKKMIRNLYLKFGVNEDFLLNGSLPILVCEKKENQYCDNSSSSEVLNQLFAALKIRDEQIKELIARQEELLQQQKKLVETILSIAKKKKV